MMSKSKFAQTVAAQTATARRLFEVVPSDQAWSIKQMVTAAAKAGINSDYGILAGCLNTMKKAGLVLEPTEGSFQRAPYREIRVKPLRDLPASAELVQRQPAEDKLPQAAGPQKAKMPHKIQPCEPLAKHIQATKPDGKVTPTDRLGNFAAALLTMANNLEAMSTAAGRAAEDARNIAHGIEFEALSFEQIVEDNTAALAKLRSLKGMFEGI